MVDLLSILQTMYGLGTKITVLVGTFRENEEDCRRLLQLILRVSAIAECLRQQLKQTTSIVEGDKYPMMSGAFMGLKEALENGHRDIVACQCQPKKGHLNLMPVIKANHIAKELRRVSDDILTNMMVAILATVVCHFPVTAKTNPSDDALRADVKELVNVRVRDASISSKMASLSIRIVDTLPRVHLPQQVSSSLQVEESVQTYRTSMSIRYQNKDKREANKTKVHSSDITEKNNVPEDRPSLAFLTGVDLTIGSANKSASMESLAGQFRRPKASPAAPPSAAMSSSEGTISLAPKTYGSIHPSLTMQLSAEKTMLLPPKTYESIRPSLTMRLCAEKTTSLPPKTYESIRPSLTMQLSAEKTTSLSPKTYESIRPSLTMQLSAQKTTSLSPMTYESIRPSLTMQLSTEKATSLPPKTYESIRPSLTMQLSTGKVKSPAPKMNESIRPSLTMQLSAEKMKSQAPKMNESIRPSLTMQLSAKKTMLLSPKTDREHPSQPH